MAAASPQKWLEMHGGTHWAGFYTDYGVALQKRFFDHFLKGDDNGWDKQPPLQLQIRDHEGNFTERHEDGWPILRTRWTKLHLDPAGMTLEPHAPRGAATVTYDANGPGVTFLRAPFDAATEITGPLAARLCITSDTVDADLFLVVRLFDPAGQEVVFQGALDPADAPGARLAARLASQARPVPVAAPPALSRPRRTMPLLPGEVVTLDIEIWPTCIVAPAGYRIGLTVRGTDYVSDRTPMSLSNLKNADDGMRTVRPR